MPITISGSGTITGITAGGLPDAIITQPDLAANVAGNGPAFSAYASAAQTVTSNVDTKVVFDTEQFDTNNNFSSNRFTPTVAGYYQLNTVIRFNGTASSAYIIYFYKNGTATGIAFNANAALGTLLQSVSTLLYLNGSTDYVEVYTNITATSPTLGAGSGNVNTNYFSGCLIRSA